MDQYDEDICQNTFFQNLKNTHDQLYDLAANNRWTLCVPRVGSLGDCELTRDDVESHVLVPAQGGDTGRYRTVSGKEVSIKDGVISTDSGFLDHRLVPILFEETFYNKKDESYCVLCVNQPLAGGDAGVDFTPDQPIYSFANRSVEECANLLWGTAGNPKTRKQLASLLDAFLKRLSSMDQASLTDLLVTTSSFFDKAMSVVLKDPYMMKMSSQDASLLDSVKHAVETHLMYGVHKRLFKLISSCLGTKNAQLNKVTRNLAQVQLQHLGVRIEYCQNVPRARKELSNLTLHRTPHGKMSCLRRVVAALTRPGPGTLAKAANPAQLTTDDLLPILVFLVLKADIPNWWAHFEHMSRFRFSKTSLDNEYGFYLASLEAALVHVSSGKLLDLECNHQPDQQPPPSFTVDAPETSLWHRQDQDNRAVSALFQYVRDKNKPAVLEILQTSRTRRARLSPPSPGNVTMATTPSPVTMATALCHPLCACERCRSITAAAGRDGAKTVTVHSRDGKGFTVLHTAAFHGLVEMCDVVLQQGALVDGTDYRGQTALHVACRRGHQAVVLLLLHHGAGMTVQDGENNSPLHLAATNGHDDCVKALVFFAQGSSALNVNATNDFGDTALHLATKWGYLSLVRFLLDNGASVLVKNRKHHDALRYSHTSQMSEAISRAALEQAQAVTFHRQMSMRKTISMNDFNPPKVEIAPSLDTSGRVHDLTRSLSVVPSQLASARKVTRAGSMGSILGEQSLSHSRRRRSSDASDKGRSLVNKKVDKLLKAVTDGDINMARFHLGWSSDSEDEEEEARDLDLSDRELCHPLCQCDQCQPLQKLTSLPARCSVHVNSRDGSGHTPLHAAAHGGHPALVALFLRRGANVNSRTLGTESSPLHLACKQRDVEVMKILLSHGADVNAQDCDGNSPLHHCCMMGSDKKVALLILHKADVGLANQKGDSPLHAAVRWNLRAVVRLLLAHGAPPEGRNRDGKLPLHYSQTEEMCNLLRQAMSTARITREAHTSNRKFPGHGSTPSRYVSASDASRTASESPTSSTLTSSGRSDTSSAETVRPVTSAADSSPELTEEESPAPRRATAKSPTSSENYCTVDGNLVSVVIPPDDAIAAMKRASFGESFGDGLTIVDDYFEVEPLSNSSSVYVTGSIDQADQRDSDCCSENSNTESQQDLSIA